VSGISVKKTKQNKTMHVRCTQKDMKRVPRDNVNIHKT